MYQLLDIIIVIMLYHIYDTYTSGLKVEILSNTNEVRKGKLVWSRSGKTTTGKQQLRRALSYTTYVYTQDNVVQRVGHSSKRYYNNL